MNNSGGASMGREFCVHMKGVFAQRVTLCACMVECDWQRAQEWSLPGSCNKLWACRVWCEWERMQEWLESVRIQRHITVVQVGVERVIHVIGQAQRQTRKMSRGGRKSGSRGQRTQMRKAWPKKRRGAGKKRKWSMGFCEGIRRTGRFSSKTCFSFPRPADQLMDGDQNRAKNHFCHFPS